MLIFLFFTFLTSPATRRASLTAQAREHAFAMEKERIDDWLASKGKSAPSGQIATEAGGDLPAVSTGLGVGSHRWHLPVLCRGGLPERKS
jgi:hypothetical protein